MVLAGGEAHPRALAAVRYALAQLGDPYVWAAEGPNAFDCSGLMWAAYRTAGADYFGLPRVARDQYYATRHRTVAPSALLPGDLIFFASSSSWTSVHHVGMYIGEGKMVHAPTFGDVVRIAPVDTSRIYAATRIFGAVSEQDAEAGQAEARASPGPTSRSPRRRRPSRPRSPASRAPSPASRRSRARPRPTRRRATRRRRAPNPVGLRIPSDGGTGSDPSPAPGDESSRSPEPTPSSSAAPTASSGTTGEA